MSTEPPQQPRNQLRDSAAVALPPLVLASASPRRSELLRSLGLAFETLPADVDEAPRPGEAPYELAGRLARAKASAVAEQRPDAFVVAADTVVTLDGLTLNKPEDDAENRRFLQLLQGRQHEVFTGHAFAYRGQLEAAVVRTAVTFRPLDAMEIERYVATGEGRDKAGGYAVQGRGAALVSRIEGCYSNVVGLSLPTVVLAARHLGVTLV